MKRIVSFLLILGMLITPAFCESLDLESMSVEDLIALHEEIDAILKAKLSCELGSIYPGYYIAGKDIKEGSYRFTCTEIGSSSTCWILKIYNTEEDLENRNSFANINLEFGDQAVINLTDGMVLKIGDGLGTIETMEKPSWAP